MSRCLFNYSLVAPGHCYFVVSLLEKRSVGVQLSKNLQSIKALFIAHTPAPHSDHSPLEGKNCWRGYGVQTQ